MADRDNLPVVTSTTNALVTSEQSGGIVRRGLDALRNQQKQALPLKGQKQALPLKGKTERESGGGLGLEGPPPYRGDGDAQFRFAEMYYHGSRVAERRARIWAIHQAVKWWELAAKQGYAPAQFRLGDAFHDGYGLPQNQTLAVRWWHMAAEQGLRSR